MFFWLWYCKDPPSVILETANDKRRSAMNDEVVVLDYDELEQDSEEVEDINNVTSANIEDHKNKGTRTSEESALEDNDTVGICVSYKKEVIDSSFKDQKSNVLHTDWCALYEKGCTSFSRDTTDPRCLRNLVRTQATVASNELLKHKESSDKRTELISKLEGLLGKAKSILKTK